MSASNPGLGRRRLLIAGGLSLLARGGHANSEVVLYAYHLKPPYLEDLEHRQGLYFELAELLGLRTPGIRFRTEYLPRRRLEADLEGGRLHGLVIGVNPVWFKDAQRSRYLWSAAFMHDTDVVVSLHKQPVLYNGPDSLAGLNIALPRGYYYYGVDELVQAGKARRTDCEGEESALMMMVLGRVQATIITRRTLYAFLARRPGLRGQFHVALQPHDEYERFILVPQEFAEVLKPLNDALHVLARDPGWQARLQERTLYR